MSQPADFRRFIPRLESLRGLAAVSVVAYHAYAMRNDTFVTGMAPVVLFFVLSGFVLARSLERDPAPGRFFRNRLFRLLPAAAATVLLLTVLHEHFGFYVGFEASFDWMNVLLNAILIRSDINGVMWSLTVEGAASPVILGSFLLYKRSGFAPVLAFALVLLAISSWGPYVHLLGGFTNLAPMYAFVVGVLLHFAPNPALSSRRLVSGTASAVAVFLICGLRKQTAITILGETASAGAMIYFVAGAPKARLFAALDTFPVQLLGRISYSFYLLHPIGLSLASRISGNTLSLFCIAVIITTPMAWLSWLLIERPFIQFVKSRTIRDLASDYA